MIRYESLNEAGELELVTTDTDLFKGILARHIMTPMVMCLHEDKTIGQAAEFFIRSRINSTPVVNAQGKLVGMLSEKDLMAAMVSLDYWKQPVSSVMKPNVITYEEDTPARTIYEFLCRVAMRRIVIVKDGCPTGTISRGTLLRLFRNLVISKGLLEPETYDMAPHKRRSAKLSRAFGRILPANCPSRFPNCCCDLQDDTEDLMPYVVGGATGMQSLVDELLAYSNFADSDKNTAAELQANLTQGNCVE